MAKWRESDDQATVQRTRLAPTALHVVRSVARPSVGNKKNKTVSVKTKKVQLFKSSQSNSKRNQILSTEG